MAAAVSGASASISGCTSSSGISTPSTIEILIPVEIIIVILILFVTIYFLRKKLMPALVHAYGALTVICRLTSAPCGAGFNHKSFIEADTEDKNVMTIEIGIRRDKPLREPIVAKLAQNCQKCGDAIIIGDLIIKYSCGWCHESCTFLPVGTYND